MENSASHSACPPALPPAAPVQEQIWFQEQWTPPIGVYNIPTALRLTGPLDEAALRRALDSIIERHETLRTAFTGEGTRLLQAIRQPEPMPFRLEDFTHLEPAAREETLRARLRDAAREPFSLKRDLLARAWLFRLASDCHVLLISMHHIASDEWSVRVLLDELKALYAAFRRGEQPALPELPIQYADYAEWHKERLDQGIQEQDLNYWRAQLQGELPRLDFPRDRAHSGNRTFEGARVRLDLGEGASAAAETLARDLETTPFIILLAAYQAALARFTGQHEILTGTAVAGRGQSETEPLIGLFSNVVVIRAELPAETSFRQLALQLKGRALEAFAHQETPFHRVISAVRQERSTGPEPLFQTVFAFQNEILERGGWSGLEAEWLEAETGTSKFDLTTTAVKTARGFTLVTELNTDFFKPDSIRRFLEHCRNLLTAAAEAPDQNIWTLPILSPEEKRLLLDEWSSAPADYPRDAMIHELFEEQARRSPDSTALVLGTESWTYAELNRRADELAAALRRLGAGPETMIGLCMHRSLEMIPALLAILKSGACYVPLDPDYPPERLAAMIEDTQAPILITQPGLRPKLASAAAKILVLGPGGALQNPPPPGPSAEPAKASADHAAYVIYTSGSTGRPKGVIVPHRAVVRLVKGANYADLGPDQSYLQFATISFDASTFEIWAPLLNGGRLCIMPPGKSSLDDLAAAIAEYKITTLWLTTGLFNLMADEKIEGLRGPRQLLTGGEAGSIPHMRKFLREYPGCALIHCYGPTENTTFTTAMTLRREHLQDGLLPIGKPVSNTTIYILDDRLQPVPPGAAGRLFTGGDGLAREYLHAPDLTRQRFIPPPWKPGERLYDTGDLARFLPDGSVQYLGRRDRQVKIRGFRIELGEIEAALVSHPAVEEAAVIAADDTALKKRLIAYWTPASGRTASEDELRAHLAKSLPDFMAPQLFIRLEKLPLDPNGKVDRKALPAPAPDRAAEPAEFAPPRDELEQNLAAIWREALGLPRIGLHDNFFHLGGHSLLATQVISRVKRRLAIDLPLRALFDHPTLARFAEAARAHQQAKPKSSPITRRQSPQELLARLGHLSEDELNRLLNSQS